MVVKGQGKGDESISMVKPSAGKLHHKSKNCAPYPQASFSSSHMEGDVQVPFQSLVIITYEWKLLLCFQLQA